MQVHIYDCIMTQPKDIFLRVAAHELGHSFFEPYLKAAKKYELIAQQWTIIKDSDSIFGKDQGPLVGKAEFRRNYQKGSFDEFLAEVFMHYIMDANELLDYIKSLQEGKPEVYKAWTIVYTSLKDALSKDYDSGTVWKSLLGL